MGVARWELLLWPPSYQCAPCQDYHQVAALHSGDFERVTAFYGNGPLFHPPEFKPSDGVVTGADVRKRCREILTLPPEARTSHHIDFLVNLTSMYLHWACSVATLWSPFRLLAQEIAVCLPD